MSASASTERRWQRHFEGWQVALVAGSLALGAVALALPRAVLPRELPLPRIDRVEQSRQERDDDERVRRAEARPLPYLVRAAGEALRQYGVAEASADAASADAARSEFAKRVAEARRRHGDEALLALRAVQSRLFVRRLTLPRIANDRELIELGGAFLSRADRSGWLDRDGRVALREDEAACIFRVRWDKLAGLLEVYPFSPSLNEWRLYYRTLIQHPTKPSGAASRSEIAPLLAYVDSLVKCDPEYPALLARGIVAFWDGDFAGATELFSRHLASHPSGPWRLRAQNYLLAAYGRAPK